MPTDDEKRQGDYYMSNYTFNGINSLSVLEQRDDRSGKCAAYRVDEAEAKAVTAVFEGSGALSDVTYIEHDGASGAHIGTRLSAAATMNWFSSGRCRLDDSDADRLRSSIDLLMRRAKRGLDYEGQPLFKKKTRTFPTSAAVCAVDYYADDGVDCEFLWAGNCRGYVLDGYGLCQITSDDIDGDEDAYLRRAVGAKLNNVINADTEYTVNFRRIRITDPMLLITATTAAFDDFGSPMELEYAILYALVKSNSVAEWEKKLKNIIKEYAEDDFAVTVMSVGFEDFDHMKSYYEGRIRELVEDYIRPLNASRKGQSRISIDALWNRYKNGYYR